jgi:arylsulfatase A-like enzyme
MYYRGDEKAPGEPINAILESEANPVDKRDELYGWLEGVTDWDYPVRQYAAGVSYVDHHVGLVLADLKEQGLYDDMLIVLIADHGEHLGEHGLYYTHTLPFQETVHVPLIIKWPGNMLAGHVVDEWVSTLDVLPTVLEQCGIGVPPGLDGHSLLPLLEAGAERPPSLLVAEQGSSQSKYCKAIVQWPWKYMLFSTRDRTLHNLYNLAEDPGERVNVAQQNPEVARRLDARLWEIFDRNTPLTSEKALPPLGITDETRRKLRALGYVD